MKKLSGDVFNGNCIPLESREAINAEPVKRNRAVNKPPITSTSTTASQVILTHVISRVLNIKVFEISEPHHLNIYTTDLSLKIAFDVVNAYYLNML